MKEDAAEREPLLHPTGEGADALVPRLPEPEALEERSDGLPPLGHVVEAPVEVEVLECGELLVDQRLVGQVADAPSREVDLDLAFGRREQAGHE